MLGFNENRPFFGTSRDTSWEIEGTACPDPEGFIFMITPKGLFSMLPGAEENNYHVYALTYSREQAPSELIK